MIRLTRLNNIPFYLNPDLIEHVESTPDTLISLTNGQKYMVLEAAEEVLEKVVALRQRIYEGVLLSVRNSAAGGE
ncbi:MAG: flagellar FlbD family protein [Bryobacteraceae bacterium]|mgnify:FL=1|nr:flagellar FlbD family protein [Solibacteraceae bacterium]MCL4840625.1 flagellar FlbD family protein [Bryobacteraceae bacterium]MCO5350579.1 flagellar FlbD family protein [Bryobacteraceae bacterium]HAX41961.1 flagellar protein [Bryobacterales bacterium]HRJ17995.1 flagellar FlbD family protein [Bryobacteraceae bacterium]